MASVPLPFAARGKMPLLARVCPPEKLSADVVGAAPSPGYRRRLPTPVGPTDVMFAAIARAAAGIPQEPAGMFTTRGTPDASAGPWPATRVSSTRHGATEK